MSGAFGFRSSAFLASDQRCSGPTERAVEAVEALPCRLPYDAGHRRCPPPPHRARPPAVVADPAVVDPAVADRPVVVRAAGGRVVVGAAAPRVDGMDAATADRVAVVQATVVRATNAPETVVPVRAAPVEAGRVLGVQAALDRRVVGVTIGRCLHRRHAALGRRVGSMRTRSWWFPSQRSGSTKEGARRGGDARRRRRRRRRRIAGGPNGYGSTPRSWSRSWGRPELNGSRVV